MSCFVDIVGVSRLSWRTKLWMNTLSWPIPYNTTNASSCLLLPPCILVHFLHTDTWRLLYICVESVCCRSFFPLVFAVLGKGATIEADDPIERPRAEMKLRWLQERGIEFSVGPRYDLPQHYWRYGLAAPAPTCSTVAPFKRSPTHRLGGPFHHCRAPAVNSGRRLRLYLLPPPIRGSGTFRWPGTSRHLLSDRANFV